MKTALYRVYEERIPGERVPVSPECWNWFNARDIAEDHWNRQIDQWRQEFESPGRIVHMEPNRSTDNREDTVIESEIWVFPDRVHWTYRVLWIESPDCEIDAGGF